MYVDESGDVGTVRSPSYYFVLSAMVVHESAWWNLLDDVVIFRRKLRDVYGLRMKEEIHASDFVTGRPKLRATIPRNYRLDLLKRCLQWLSSRNDISVFSVRCNKSGRADVFDFTWRVLIQRFENTLGYNNFPTPQTDDKGIIIADDTHAHKLTTLLREMRRYNQVPSMVPGSGARSLTLRSVIEDPVFRNSANSYLHQMTDIIAYFARQYYEPNRYVRRKGARTFYGILDPVINQHVTGYSTPHRIVEI